MTSTKTSSCLSVVDTNLNKKGKDQENTLVTATAPDYIASSHAVKEIFSFPYAVDRPISVVVHNLSGTLLLDSDPGQEIEKWKDRFTPALTTPIAPTLPCEIDEAVVETPRSLVALTALQSNGDSLKLVNSIIQSNRPKPPPPSSSSSSPIADDTTVRPETEVMGIPGPNEMINRVLPDGPEPREYLPWKFHNMNLLVGSESMIVRGPETALVVRVEDADHLRTLARAHHEMIQNGEFRSDRQWTKPSYAEATRRWLLEEDGAAPPNIQQQQGGGYAPNNLDQVQLQTCNVPSPQDPIGRLPTDGLVPTDRALIRSSSPISTVLDAYLDNIMANVPQLALCLQERGFVQSVKVLNTEQIPSTMLRKSTIDTTKPFEVIEELKESEQIFSPEIMEMNAVTLLRFLKSHCTKDNTTYLLQREAGHTNVQLYDISSISAQRQQKWNWWLAMMSNRFANRLRSLAAVTTDRALRRSFRARQRSLLGNALDLLEALADINGSSHESLIAAIHENIADTYLTQDEDEVVVDAANTEPSTQPSPATTAVPSQQPYSSIAVDALNKAQDQLLEAIRVLSPILERILQRQKLAKKRKSTTSVPILVKSISSDNDSSGDSSDDDDDGGGRHEKDYTTELCPMATQLFGLHYKVVGVSLRLAEIHLGNYYSSSAMQSLRSAARRLSDSLFLAQIVALADNRVTKEWAPRLQLQYTWLWEHCGHFARSFAADQMWRERGHTSGDDIVSVLQDIDSLLRNTRVVEETSVLMASMTHPNDILSSKSYGLIGLRTLSGVVGFRPSLDKKSGQGSWFDDERVELAEMHLSRQKLLQREQRRVLVAACVAYGRAIDSYRSVWSNDCSDTDRRDSSFLNLLWQRLGDACNETGKLTMNAVRSLLTSLPSGTSLSDGKDEHDDGDEDNVADAAGPLLCSAEFWFIESLSVFEECKDMRNVALLRCNLCQCWKLRANSLFAEDEPKSPDGSPYAELCLQEAANHLQRAHEVLGQRETDPLTWDMVSGELAATFLVLGVRRRQTFLGSGTIPVTLQALRLPPGKERAIVEPMERSLDIYLQSGNQHQAAAVHYQMALFYSKIWTCQRDETKTREKLASAFHHFNKAHAFFSQKIRGNEPTFCLLCLDLSNLYSTVSGEECLIKALLRCVDTSMAFSPDSIDAVRQDTTTSKSKEWLEKMDTLASSVEERAFKILRSLVKLEESGLQASGGRNFKEIYRIGLLAKMAPLRDPVDDPIIKRLLTVHGILEALQEKL